ncbi:MAG TPA: hypothetical protein VFP54_04645 [Acidimicrobiales bacterium]|nr:hypothetical protein [Acidimicrobiales bacterium]
MADGGAIRVWLNAADGVFVARHDGTPDGRRRVEALADVGRVGADGRLLAPADAALAAAAELCTYSDVRLLPPAARLLERPLPPAPLALGADPRGVGPGPEQMLGWQGWHDAALAASVRTCGCCEACGEDEAFPQGAWDFDDARRVCTLVGVRLLCETCSLSVTATAYGDGPAAGTARLLLAGRLAELNGWTPQVATAHVAAAAELFALRRREPWTAAVGASLGG